MKAAWAWVIWLVAVLVVLSVTRNPFYLVMILSIVAFVYLRLRVAGYDLHRPFSLWKLAMLIILLATVFNALTSHFGQTVLFTIPGKIPLVSGNVTLEAFVYGAINGMILTGMLASFSVLNMALPMRDLIGLIPRAFFPVAVVTSIAVTYLPTTLRQFEQIREAQEVRGHQMRTLRDWLPLLMPLLVGGLEHAMQLAEAMTARGFASTRPETHTRASYARGLLLGGVLALLAGWLLELGTDRGYGRVLIISGVVLILLGLWSFGRQAKRTVYHNGTWGWKDGVAIISALAAVGVIALPIAGLGRETLYYDPYPVLQSPGVSLGIGLAVMGLVVPGLLLLINPPNETKYK